MKQTSFLKRIITVPYLVWSVLFVIVPLIIMAYFSFTDVNGSFSLANLSNLGKYKNAFFLSILYALIATAVTLIISYPVAYIMTQISVNAQRLMLVAVMLPMWTNFLIRTYSWMSILANTGIINTILKSLGFSPVKLINTPGAVILGMVYDFFPYMILPIYNVMSKIDNSLLEAASDLGANRFGKIKKVIFPLSLPGVISGITMVFVPSVSTFYISQKLGGNKTMLIGDTIEYLFNLGPSYYNIASALSLILMVLIIGCLLIMNKFSGDEEGEMII